MRSYLHRHFNDFPMQCVTVQCVSTRELQCCLNSGLTISRLCWFEAAILSCYIFEDIGKDSHYYKLSPLVDYYILLLASFIYLLGMYTSCHVCYYSEDLIYQSTKGEILTRDLGGLRLLTWSHFTHIESNVKQGQVWAFRDDISMVVAQFEALPGSLTLICSDLAQMATIIVVMCLYCN